MAKYTTTTVTTLHCPSCDSDKVIKARQARRPPALPLQELQEGIPFERQHPGRRFPPEQVGAALGMFYNGMSYKQIAENMEDMFDIPEPSKATVYEWVRDYSARALESMKRHRARTGDEWVADELVVRVGGQKYWLFNLMDTRTRYILAAHLSKYRGASAARDLMRKGAANAVNLPKTIKTDHLRSYISAIKDQVRRGREARPVGRHHGGGQQQSQRETARDVPGADQDAARFGLTRHWPGIPRRLGTELQPVS